MGDVAAAAGGTDLYQILGVARNASDADVRVGYLHMAKQWHPDKNKDNQGQAADRFKMVRVAYEVLSDPGKRAKYDDYMSRPARHEELLDKLAENSSEDQLPVVFDLFFGSGDPFTHMFNNDMFGGDLFAANPPKPAEPSPSKSKGRKVKRPTSL